MLVRAPTVTGAVPIRSSRLSVLCATIFVVLAVGSSAPICSPAWAKPSPYLASDRSLVDVYAAVEGARVGEVLPGGPEHFITVVDSPRYKEIVHEYGKTFPAGADTACTYNSPLETEAVGCTITIYGASHAHGNSEIREVIAHEVFHVFEARMSGSRETFATHGAWLIEGAASWVESDLLPHDRLARAEWKEYLKSPQVQLFSRSYEAIGFFGHMQSSSLSPWSRFKAMFKAESSPAAYTAGVGSSTAFLDSEASAFFREPGLGPEWDTQGANVPTRTEVDFHPTAVNIKKGTTTLTVKPYADGAYDLSISGLSVYEPVVELTVGSGNVRLHSTAGGSVNTVDPKQVLLCSDPKGCSCPQRPNHYEQFQRGDLAITGGPTGGEVKLAVRKPCEVLLAAVACETLLPGFTAPVNPVAVALVGSPLSSTHTSPGGSTDSSCALLAKGTEESNAEGESAFVGVLAPLVNVLRASSIGGAISYYKIISSALPPGYTVSRPTGVGEEAQLVTKTYTNAAAQTEYGSFAMVRVQNIVAEFGLVSTPGNDEADPAQSLALLRLVAQKL